MVADFKPPNVPHYSDLIVPPTYFPDVGKLRSRVKVCCWVDKPTGLNEITTERPGVFDAWAFVAPLGPIAMEGTRIAHNGDRKEPTHTIVIRVPSDSFVDRNFWVYRETRYAKQWFRIQRVEDLSDRDRMLWLLCNLVENYDVRQDPAVQTTEPKLGPISLDPGYV